MPYHFDTLLVSVDHPINFNVQTQSVSMSIAIESESVLQKRKADELIENEDGEVQQQSDDDEYQHESSSSSSTHSSPQKQLKKAKTAPITTNAQLFQLFQAASGYKFDVPLGHITVALSKPNADKQAAYKKKCGRDNMELKDRFVNINVLFRTLPMDEKIISKFLPDLEKKLKREPFPYISMSAPGKLRWSRLTGLGTFDKTKNRPKTVGEACHEFSLTVSAYRDDSVDDRGRDPDALKWISKVAAINNYIGTAIANNTQLAPKHHEACKELLDRDPGDVNVPYKDRYVAKFVEAFVKPLDDVSELKFSTRMFRYPSAEEKEMFAVHPYIAPNEQLQRVYDDAGRNDKIVYNDMPVVRPKTPAEAAASWPADPNPFVYIPFSERGQITDGALAATLYEYALTESYNNKSYLKLKAMMLIWFPGEPAPVSTLAMDRPFVFNAVQHDDIKQDGMPAQPQHDEDY